MNTPHPSSSAEQRRAEDDLKKGLAQKLDVVFKPPPSSLTPLVIDAYADGEPPMLIELFAHVGRSKAGQKRKLSRDMTKLLLAERKLDRACRKIIAVLDGEAISHFATGWDGEFAQCFGVELLVVAVPEQLKEKLREVQNRQRR